MKPSENRPPSSRAHRMVSYGFGVFFVAIGIVIFIVAEFSLGAAIAGVVLVGLGMDVIVSARRNKTSLLARIGPLP